LVRYGFVGGIAAVVDIGSFSLFSIVFKIEYRVAVFMSFTLGTLTNFAISNAFVFNRRSLVVWRACLRHYFSSLGGLVTNELVMMLFVEALRYQNLIIAKIIATGAAFFVNFTLIRFYAFNSKLSLSRFFAGLLRREK
jgi:putative flippase GtrA